MRKTSRLAISMIFASLMVSTAHGKALRSPVQTGDNIIIAKGDIPTPEKYQPAIQEYLTFVNKELSEMVEQLEKLNQSIQKGQLAQAKAAYIQAHQHYETVRPIIVLFGNTDRTINSRADYFLDKEKDYRFVGFHLVEYLLFSQQDLKAALPASDELLLKGRDLQKRVLTETIEIPKLVQASADFIEMILETKLSGKENIYSQTDLFDMAANAKGSQVIIDVISPFVEAKTLDQIKENDQKINKIVQSYQLAKGQYAPYSQLKQQDKMTLYSLLTQQAELLATLRAQLDVDVYYKY
ncbi:MULTISPECIES: EfeM/EfeO family lipoprotein [Providencia]|uniref:Imelysin n=1 Tax=Providencia alcalifaciens DSM 30120 TaxID=520999 RepID=B6XG41_9GAMM|nr:MULTISPECIES: EfeM/EfeO family lipoprotein [Providencia]ATG16435.1 Efem/EfeO family lipoprotein [Providencia alcalifaciens]EEB45601.1 Imelysin [Providencia alcalifaciens DSM 30120]MTC27446.1 EfeM/EfeO family lipoprotein [Providencia alcalifaciens]QLQ96647.1 EfeM/EfeO family lipoprotein [Providencia alcalifaciens]SPY64430.1 Iron uptake system component EfeO precursor [Providencia alcalifaciens]